MLLMFACSLTNKIFCLSFFFSFFFFNDTATTEIYTLSLHDALPIFSGSEGLDSSKHEPHRSPDPERSEEHTSELQSPCNLVCRLLLEKKKTNPRHTLTVKKKKKNTKAIITEHITSQ